jgi:hypothetical protein
VDIARAATDEEILACWPVMATLRPHLAREEFVARVRRVERSADLSAQCGGAGAAACSGSSASLR